MAPGSGWVIRAAGTGDVRSICEFGGAHIRPHYTPLIGAEAANAQVSQWWNDSQIRAAASAGLIVIAESDDAACDEAVIGVAQCGRSGADHVIYKLYIHPLYRGQGLGRRLIEAIVGQVPPGTTRLGVEHFASNERAGAFYEREGFVVQRVDPSAAGDPALDVVWRTKALAAGDRPTTVP